MTDKSNTKATRNVMYDTLKLTRHRRPLEVQFKVKERILKLL